jgi:DNA-directed RNA polymerase specialized sigma subunit
MSAILLEKQHAGGDQDVQNRIALSDERDFERLLETALPLVRPVVRHLKRSLPRKFEADEIENMAVTALLAAVRDYCASPDGNFVSYSVTRIRGAILDELAE